MSKKAEMIKVRIVTPTNRVEDGVKYKGVEGDIIDMPAALAKKLGPVWVVPVEPEPSALAVKKAADKSE